MCVCLCVSVCVCVCLCRCLYTHHLRRLTAVIFEHLQQKLRGVVTFALQCHVARHLQTLPDTDTDTDTDRDTDTHTHTYTHTQTHMAGCAWCERAKVWQRDAKCAFHSGSRTDLKATNSFSSSYMCDSENDRRRVCLPGKEAMHQPDLTSGETDLDAPAPFPSPPPSISFLLHRYPVPCSHCAPSQQPASQWRRRFCHRHSQTCPAAASTRVRRLAQR